MSALFKNSIIIMEYMSYFMVCLYECVQTKVKCIISMDSYAWYIHLFFVQSSAMTS